MPVHIRELVIRARVVHDDDQPVCKPSVETTDDDRPDPALVDAVTSAVLAALRRASER